jgi:hypothetical protein
MRQTAGSRPSRSNSREGRVWPPARRQRLVRYAYQGLGPRPGSRRGRRPGRRKASVRPFLAGAGALVLLVPVAWWSMGMVTGSTLGYAASAAQEGMWSRTGSMQTARDYHSATPLLDGTVLVAGGFVGTQFPDPDSTDTAELYDPSTGTWSATDSMASPRAGHKALLLGTGAVLVVGGFHQNTAVTTAELYDPGNGTWSTADAMGTQRTAFATTVLDDGRVLVTGGVDPGTSTDLESAELYDPASNSWSPAATMGTLATVTPPPP